MKRCAVYTRKSTDEGLEQDFNSLQAQREACEAYIKSQKHEGWKLVRTQFDDGGHSGGTLDRPALQGLLDAVDRNEIDVVVVYKVDRLTRSLADFAKIVERFDERCVSFVSVTQQFNTTSSMGRLTLNVLLSFAQFEREVTAERIRDKIAASKKKGMWMGGPPPLGYDSIDKKLVVNEPEADSVRTLFRLYLELGNVRDLQREARRRGITTKRRCIAGSKVSGGKPFSRGNLYQLLRNPLYVGRVPHRGETYPGQHEAIVDEDIWQAVQARLAKNSSGRRVSSNTRHASPLAGLVFDESGDRLCPTHANKNGKRYRYYISQRLMHDADRSTNGWRLRAEELEEAVIAQLVGLLDDQQRLIKMLGIEAMPISELQTLEASAKTLAEKLGERGKNGRSLALSRILYRVDLSPSELTLHLDWRGLVDHLGLQRLAELAQESNKDAMRISAPMALRRRGVEAKLVIENGSAAARNPDPNLCKLIAKARSWFDELATGSAISVRAIAQREGIHETEVSRALPLAFLAPQIVDSILAGRQPIDLTADHLHRLGTLPSDWTEQHRLLGFPS